jgi:hypothetical protein
MPLVPELPWPLLAVGVGAIVVGMWPLFWILRRIGRALAGRAQRHVSLLGYVAALATGSLLVGAGLTLLGLAAALQGYSALARKTHIAEVQCIELEPAHLRLYYVPIERDGVRGPTEEYDLRGDQWTVGGSLLRFRPMLAALHVGPVYKITRVEGRWLRAEDANHNAATAHDREGGTSRGWLALYRNGTRGPLGWLVASVQGEAVSQLPDRRAVFDLYVTPAGGLVAEKRSL